MLRRTLLQSALAVPLLGVMNNISSGSDSLEAVMNDRRKLWDDFNLDLAQKVQDRLRNTYQGIWNLKEGVTPKIFVAAIEMPYDEIYKDMDKAIEKLSHEIAMSYIGAIKGHYTGIKPVSMANIYYDENRFNKDKIYGIYSVVQFADRKDTDGWFLANDLEKVIRYEF